MHLYQPQEIPKSLRVKHSSSITAVPCSGIGGSADYLNMYYSWQAFGGNVYFISTPSKTQTLTPTVKLYVNRKNVSTVSPSKTKVGDGYLYEVLFGGLSYGDTYYIEWTYHDDIGWTHTNSRTYTGQRGDPPTISTDGDLISCALSAPYNKPYSTAVGILTFQDDYGSLNTYSREARNLLYTACLQSTEIDPLYGKIGNLFSFRKDIQESRPTAFTTEAKISKFYLYDGEDRLKVGITSPKSTRYYSSFSQYVNEWINDINTLLGYALFIRDDSISEKDKGIRITLGSHEELWGYTPEHEESDVHVYFGTFEITWWYSKLNASHHSEVKLCNELRGAMVNKEAFRDITYEELTESLGCSNDTVSTYESMFSEIWYIGKRNRLIKNGEPTIDGQVVQMLYNELELGEKASDVVHKLTPSTGACIPLPNAINHNANGRYSINAFAMNRAVVYTKTSWSWNSSHNCFSNIGRSIDVVSSQRPRNFSWTNPKISGGKFNLTAAEWNAFVTRVNDFRRYKNLSNYHFTTARPGEPFTAAMYQEAKSAIQGVEGYGSYIPSVSKGDSITAERMNILVSELNAIP